MIQAPNLVAESDLVVVGSVKSRIDATDSVSFDVDILRALKGKVSQSTLHVDHKWSRKGTILGPDVMVVDQFAQGIWFLRRIDDSNWEVSPARGPDGIFMDLFLPALSIPSSRSPYIPAPSASPAEKVVLEVAAALEAQNMQPEILLGAARNWDSPAVSRILNTYIQSPNASFRAVGIAGLLRRRAPGAVQLLSQIWPSIAATPNREYVISAIKQSFRDTSPQSISDLVLLVNETNDRELRAAVIWALKSIHSKESLPFLAALLSSSDPEEQMAAIIGISSFANGCPPQTEANIASLDYMTFINPSVFRNSETIAHFAFGPVDAENRTRLAAFWSSWWDANRQAVTEQ